MIRRIILTIGYILLIYTAGLVLVPILLINGYFPIKKAAAYVEVYLYKKPMDFLDVDNPIRKFKIDTHTAICNKLNNCKVEE